MKILKEKLIAVVLVGVLLLTGLFAIGQIPSQKASAVPPGYKGEEVYYFTDYYPLLSYDEFKELHPRLTVFIDRQYIDEQELANMVNSNYFEMLRKDCIAIVDIKTFIPEPQTLMELLSILKNQGCKTVFVAGFDESDYGISFEEFVDQFIDDRDCIRLKNFLFEAIYDYDYRLAQAENTVYLLDSNLVDVKNHFQADMDTLCATSPFLRNFLVQLIGQLGDYRWTSYTELAYILQSQYKVHILVLFQDGHINLFMDVLTWHFYQYRSVRALMREYDDVSHACAFGFWALTDEFYDILYNTQNVENYDIPVYALNIDPIQYSSLGLKIFTSAELKDKYGEIWYDPAVTSLEEFIRKYI